MVNALTAIVP
ncbi:hypothetical protein GQ600_23494 [Phytophthora cactorum]|nr:hypothetical protein GQ600_23494 [Phytophthora cactorum]